MRNSVVGTAVEKLASKLLVITEIISAHWNKQESCAIAKMTAQCAPHMGALKIFGTIPDYAHGYFSQIFSWDFVLIGRMNVHTKLDVCSFTRS